MTVGRCLGKGRVTPRPDLPTLSGHRLGLARAPSRIDRRNIKFAPGLWGNDTLGDCTAVALANYAKAQAALRGWELDVTLEDVLGFYAQSTGWNAGVPGSDQGGVLAEVLGNQFTRGWVVASQQTDLVGSWASVDISDRNALALVACYTGMCSVGLQLSQSDLEGDAWVLTDSKDAAFQPGSAGGHNAGIWDFEGLEDDAPLRMVTWGTLRPSTWGWVRSRIDEAYMVLWRQLLSPSVNVLSGIDFAGLDMATAAWVAQEEGLGVT